MEFLEVFKGRRSIRGYKPDPVPREVIDEILTEARWCPSWANTQAWEVVVVQGDTLEKFKAGQLEKLASQAQSKPDVPTPEKFPPKWHQQVIQVGISCLDAKGIGKEDREEKNRYFQEMFTLFGAPVMLLFLLDDQLNLPYGMMDVGIFMTGVSLLATAKGLGTLFLSTVIRYPDLLRTLFAIPENKKVIMGIVMGYPHESDPINRFERQRIAVEDFVTWLN